MIFIDEKENVSYPITMIYTDSIQDFHRQLILRGTDKLGNLRKAEPARIPGTYEYHFEHGRVVENSRAGKPKKVTIFHEDKSVTSVEINKKAVKEHFRAERANEKEANRRIKEIKKQLAAAVEDYAIFQNIRVQDRCELLGDFLNKLVTDMLNCTEDDEEE